METSLTNRQQGFFLTLVSREYKQERNIQRHWIADPQGRDLTENLDSSMRTSITGEIKHAIRYGFTEIAFDHSDPAMPEIAYLEHIQPRPHLVIAGAGHVGRALAHVAALLEFEVTVVDDRSEFANQENIPEAEHIIVKKVGLAMEELKAGPETYIVIVTRGHNHDSEALKPCIGSDAAYIGMIGSTNKVGIIKKKFLQEKWATPEQWAAIYTPIGLPIGSQTVQEIAISIAGQLVEIRSRKIKSHAK
jgi:xanthine dehydrogenase accessory factor